MIANLDNPEIAQLRRDERFKDLANRIVDAIAYDLQMAAELNAAAGAAALDKAAARYGTDLPRPMIARLVWAQMEIEHEARIRAATLRQAKNAPRRGLLSRRAM